MTILGNSESTLEELRAVIKVCVVSAKILLGIPEKTRMVRRHMNEFWRR